MYLQTYDENIDFLRGVHLRKMVAEYVNIEVNEDVAYDIINRYMEGEK